MAKLPEAEERAALLAAPSAQKPVARKSSFLSVLRVPQPARLVVPALVESTYKRWTMLAMALVLAAAHFYFISSFWAPGHHGNNQNGYLVGAKHLATRFHTGFEPASPFEFVGWMWVMADGNATAPGGGMHYPKYPIGLPLVDAIVFRAGLALFDQGTAVKWVYLVSPVSMTLALLGMFFIGRLLASSFAGLLAMILLATCPLALILANNPNSHALALFFGIWGFYFMLRWWQSGYWSLGLLGGFMLGYAVTIRYTEGLMLAPLVMAGLLVAGYRPGWVRQWWRAAIWVIVVGAVFVISDAIHGKQFEWQRALGTKFGLHLKWWMLAAAMIVPVLLTIRWNAIDRLFSRDTLSSAEWLRLLACALLVLVAAKIEVSQLEERTPAILHAARLAALLIAFCGTAVLIYAIDWRRPNAWLPASCLAIGWIMPVLGLVIFNRVTVGSWTGYDTTNESTGFTWTTFLNKWGDTANQLYNQGLYFVLPVGVLGILLGFRWSWRAAMVLLLWFLPGTLLYMAYYYGRGMPLVGYLRFFTSMLPPVVLGAVWLIHRASVATDLELKLNAASDSGRLPWWRRGSIAAPLAAGLFVALPAAVNVNNQIGSLERDHTIATNLAEVGQRVRESCPSPSIIFGHSQRLLNYLQFAVGTGKNDDDYRFYGSDYFFRDGFPVPAMGSMEADQPTPIQHVRRSFLRKAYSEMDQGERGKIQNQIMTDAIEQGKRVFLVMDASSLAAFRRSFISSSRFETATVQKWTDPSRMSALAARNLATLGADISGRGSPQTWMIVEVKLKPQQPATGPSTTPAGAAQAPATQPAATLRELYDLLRR